MNKASETSVTKSKFNICVLGVPQDSKNVGGNFLNNGELPKFDKNYKLTNTRSSENHTHNL